MMNMFKQQQKLLKNNRIRKSVFLSRVSISGPVRLRMCFRASMTPEVCAEFSVHLHESAHFFLELSPGF